jgi:hypothetical protein
VYNKTMPGVLVNSSRAKAFIKVTLPKSMQQKDLPTIERFGFDTREHAKEAIRNLLDAGIQAKME